MNNIREVNNDILKDLFEVRDEKYGRNLSDEEKEHEIILDDIAERILKKVPKKYRRYVMKQIDLIDDNILDYICYWTEKYYRIGFCDGVNLISGCLINK